MATSYFADKFVGKIAVIGQGGSGKTYLVTQIINHAANKELYPWDEEAQISGTMTVTPYSLRITKNQNVLLYDNPGQDSLEAIRKAIARQGDVYRGILLIMDGLAWNFEQIGQQQIETIIEHAQIEQIPVGIIVTKYDILSLFQNTNLLQELTQVIAVTCESLQPNSMCPYFDRVFGKKNKGFLLPENIQTIPITMMEQILANAITDWCRFNPVNGLTPMNIRLLVRALLLGYCQFIQESMPDIVARYPEFTAINDEMVNRLNYHRPTAFETQALWHVLIGSKSIEDLPEPPVFPKLFTFPDVLFMFKNFVLISQEKMEKFYEKIKGHPKVKALEWIMTDNISPGGRVRSLRLIQKLIHTMEADNIRLNKKRSKQKDELNLEQLGLDQF